MEDEKKKIFPWIKDVIQSFAASFTVDYTNDALSVLHWNIDKEIRLIYSNNDHIVERAEALYKEATYLYEHMRLKISQHSEFQNATLSCVKLMSQIIKIGLILTQGLIDSEWIERILMVIRLFPGEKDLVYDALLLVNGLKKIHHKPYSAILRNIMTEDHHEFITDPLIYMKIVLLFRRLKALVLNRYKEKYIILMTKIKPPTNLISWLASLGINGYSSYLKNFKYKRIALQLMKNNLPESFLKKIRFMALNQYNFEVYNRKFEISKITEQPSDMCIIDNTSSTEFAQDNLDMLVNSKKSVMKKKKISPTQKQRKLKLNENNRDILLNNKQAKSSSGITNHKYMKKSNKCVIVSKKKKKSKHNIIKNVKLISSTILNQDVSDSDLLFHGIEDSSPPKQSYKSTVTEADLESDSKNEISNMYLNEFGGTIISQKCTSNEHIIVPKKKKKSKCNTVKNVESKLCKDASSSTLFFHGVEDSIMTQQLQNNTVNEKDPNSCSEIKSNNLYINESDIDIISHKLFPNSDEHTTLHEEKKKSITEHNLAINSKSKVTDIHSEDISDGSLFFYDVEGSKTSFKKSKVTSNISNSNILLKRNLSEDTDNNIAVKNVSKMKNGKRLKSSKYDEDKVDSKPVVESHKQLMFINKKNKLENSLKNDVDDLFVSEISRKRRKKITSKVDSTISDSKSIYLKKLMLKKVNNEMGTSVIIDSDEPKSIHSVATVEGNFNQLDIKQMDENDTRNLVENTEHENSLQLIPNQNIYSENVKNGNFKEENNISCDTPSVHDNATRVENINILPVENENMIVQPSKKTKSARKPKVADNSSTVESTIQNIEEMFESLNSKLKKKDNVIKSTISSHINTSTSSVSNVECKDIEDMHNPEVFEKKLKSKQASNKNSTFSSECPSREDISENVTVLSQNVNIKSCENNIQEKNTNNKCVFNISDSVELSNRNDDIINQNKQLSEQSTNKYIATRNTSIGEISKNTLSNEDLNNSSIEKNTCSTILGKLAFKTNLDSINTESSLEDENHKIISIILDNVLSHIAQLNSTQSENESVLCNSSMKNDGEYSAENSSNIILESKSEFNDNSIKSTSSNDNVDIKFIQNENMHKYTVLNDKVSDHSILYSTDPQDKELQNVQNNVNAQSKIKNCFDVTEDSNSINNELDLSNENIVSINELTCSDNIINSVNDVEISVKDNLGILQSLPESEKDINVREVPNELEIENSMDNIIINKENNELNLLNKNISPSNELACSYSKHNSVNEVETSVKGEQGILKALPGSKEVSDKVEAFNSQDDIIIKKENNERSLSSKNIVPAKELACSDSIRNSLNNIIVPIKLIESTLSESEEFIDAGKNSNQLISVSSQDDNIVDDKSNEKDLLNKNVLSSNKTTDGNTTCIKEREVSLELSLECKNVVKEKLLNTENPSSLRKTTEVNNPSLFRSNFNKLEETSEKAPEDCEKYSVCSFESHEEFIILDESNSDIEDFKSSYPGKSIKNNSPIKNLQNCNYKISLVKDISTNKSKSNKENNIKKDPLLVTDDIEHSLKNNDSDRKFISDVSAVEKDSSSTLETDSPKKLEIKCIKINEQNVKNSPSEISESISSSFCIDKIYESFSEISSKNKDKKLHVESVASVPINNFSSAASTELFSMYRNELMLDEDKTDASLSSRDGILSNYQENDTKSQNFSSDHSDEDSNSSYSSQKEEEEEENTMNKLIYSEDTREPVTSKNNILSITEAKNDSMDDKNLSEDKKINYTNINDNAYEKESVISTPPRQSLRLKNKAESKCEINNEENSVSDISKIQELSGTPVKDLKLVLTDCTSNVKGANTSNNLCNSVDSCSLIPDNNENIISNQTSDIKKNRSKTKSKTKQSYVDYSTSDKRYSLRHHKSSRSADDSANLGIDLNKLKFDSPNTKCTRSRRESKFVKLLTSDVKLQDSPNNAALVKRETRSSTVKSDLNTESNVPSYNLRNRKTIIAPPKLKL